MVGLVVLVIVTALGAGVGWLWEAIAPRLPVIKSAQGFLYASDEPEQPVGSDGYFVFIGLGVGILIAILAWVLLRRYRGATVLVALTVGSLAGATLAAWVGHKIGMAQFKPVSAAAPIGARLEVPLTLNMTSLDVNKLGRWPRVNGVVAAQALAAAFAYTALAGFSAYADLGRHRSYPAPPPPPTA